MQMKLIGKLALALAIGVGLTTSVKADLVTDKKIYKDTVIWPILQNIILCRPGITGGLPANATQKQIDACWANMQGKGFRFPTLQSVKDEANHSSTMHAKLARGTWKIKIAQTPAELPYWSNRCGAPDMVTQVPMATTFEECSEKVNKWSNPDSKAMFLSRGYIVDESGNWIDHRFAYTIQPGWAAKLGHTNPRFATAIWNSKIAELKAKLAAAK
jgi:hypothetical protein